MAGRCGGASVPRLGLPQPWRQTTGGAEPVQGQSSLTHSVKFTKKIKAEVRCLFF